VLAVPARLVVLASGSGTLLQALLDAETDAYPAEVVAVLADRADAHALVRAGRHGVPADVVPLGDYPDRGTWDSELGDRVAAHQPDLVVLAGFMKILSPDFLHRFPGRVINTHPGLLPDFPGAHAVRDALAAGATLTGASVIWVDEGIDTGQLIAQAEVPVLTGDDEPRLHERIKAVERDMLVHVVASIITGQQVTAQGEGA